MTAQVESRVEVYGVAYHRNGVSGEPFHVVRFSYSDAEGNRHELIGVVFATPHYVAVFDPALAARDVIDFGENSWRGDGFEPDLRAAIEAAEVNDALSR